MLFLGYIHIVDEAKSSGLQIISLPKETHNVVRAYMDAVEFLISGTTVQWTDGDKFFVDCTGTPLKTGRCGRLFQQWMQRYLHLNFGTTDMRALHDTSAVDAMQDETITPSEAKALIECNGHNSATALAHYVKVSHAKTVI